MRGVIPKDRNWREASPRWAIEAALAEVDELRLRGALQWPTVAKPAPAFRFAEYDKLHGGIPQERIYYVANGRSDIDIVQFRQPTNDERISLSKRKVHYRRHGSPDGIGGHLLMVYTGRLMLDTIIRGAYFTTRADALLYQLWLTCEEAAKELRKAHEAYDKEKART